MELLKTYTPEQQVIYLSGWRDSLIETMEIKNRSKRCKRCGIEVSEDDVITTRFHGSSHELVEYICPECLEKRINSEPDGTVNLIKIVPIGGENK